VQLANVFESVVTR